MSEIESRFVKRGAWTNLENGPMLGRTITTDTRTGTYIIAILAISTTLGVSHLFNIFAFLYHQLRADGQPSDGLFRQQQVLLRRLRTPSDLMTDSLKLWYYWRGTSKKSLLRTIFPASLALLFAIASLAASIFSSYVLSSTNIEVLIESPFCAFPNRTTMFESRAYETRISSLADAYSDDCYNNATSLPARCNIFAKPSIPFAIQTVACPFSGDLCTSPALAFDSGLLDLNDVFGMNLADNDRVQYRRRTTCAILSQTERVSMGMYSDFPPSVTAGRSALPGEEVLMYNYGRRTTISLDDNINWTFALSLTSSNVTHDYVRNAIAASASRREIPWDPLPEMRHEDADVFLVLVQKNAVGYMEPVKDPLFSAQGTPKDLLLGGQNTSVYYSDDAASVLGCTMQYQYCAKGYTDTDHCSALGGIPANISNQDFPEASPLQLRTLNLLTDVGDKFDLTSSRGFKASEAISFGLAESLPDDQWRTELTAWESFVWASHQIALADFATGPKAADSGTNEYMTPASTTEEKELCGLQKVRKSGGFVNINVFGLAMILTTSYLFALLDIVMLRFFIYLSKFRKALSPRIERWIQDDVFQLQRRAYQAIEAGVWKNLDKEIPITCEATLLPDLPMENDQGIKSKANLLVKESEIFATPGAGPSGSIRTSFSKDSGFHRSIRVSGRADTATTLVS